MKNFLNIVKKEIKELLTKQLILSLVFMVVMFAMMGKFIGGVKEKIVEKPINLAVLDLDRSEYSESILNKLSKQKNIGMEEVAESDIKTALAEAKEKKVTVLLVIPESFEKNVKEMKGTELEIYSIIKGFSLREVTASATLVATIDSINKEISVDFIQKVFPDKDPKDITNPLNIKEFVVVKDKMTSGGPVIIQALVTSNSVMIPLLLMILIMYAGMMVITSMGLEKENKTLETLLTLPVKRISIVIGKMAGAAVVAFLMAAIYMGGFRYFMASLTPGTPDGGVALENLGLVMTLPSYILLGISLFLAILIALAICMVLGMFAQNTKSAQVMNMPIVLLVMFPYFLLMFQDIETISLPLKILLYAIPFSHPIIASKALVFHNYPIVIGGIIYMIIFAVSTMYIAARLFNTDKVLTARFSLKRLKRK